VKFILPLAFSDPTHAVPMARAADETGWHAVTVSDHVVHPEKIRSRYPYTEHGGPRWEPDTPWPDPWVTIGAMAAATTRLRFMTNVFVLPMRNPFQVAKTVGTAAILSGDRVSLGIGMGWMEDEFDLLEQPFRRRGRRADEMIEVMRTLWKGGMVEHHGEFYDFPRLQMSPAPAKPIPILVGGISEPALRRVARLGDGWISDLHTTSELADYVERLRGYRAEYGRADEPLEVVASASDAFDVDGYRRLAEAGVTAVMTLPWIFHGGPTDDLERKLLGIRRFAEDVFPAFA
jgi:probable F420-dependent oxidoreductase